MPPKSGPGPPFPGCLRAPSADPRLAMAVSELATESTFDALVQLTHRFFWCLDEFRYDELQGLMREDAVWHRQGKVLAGRAQIRAALEERPRSQRIRHVVTNPFIAEQSAGTARMIAYMIGYRADEGVSRPAPQTIDGPLRFLLVETRFVHADGRWWIADQRAIPEFEFRNALPAR
jgi:hypothetical protein